MSKTTGLYLISGFLGAGKTTLVKRLLADAGDKKIGIIMNEFGKVSIDGPILQKENLEMIELTRGSIFCSCLTMAFAESLVEMAGKGLDYVVVESSGLADPSNIGEILAGVSLQTENGYVYSGSVTVVDASQFLSDAEAVATVVKQIECADLTLVNKADLVDDETMAQVKQKVKAINPETEIAVSSFFEGVFGILGRDLSNGKYPSLRQSLNTPENKPKTLSLSYQGEASREHLESFMRTLLDSAFRIKGFVKAHGRWWEVHGVGDCVDFYETERELSESTLVIISKVGPNIIRLADSAWKSHVGIEMKLSNG